MAELVNHTEVYCHGCRTTHPARQVRDGGSIVGEVDCPVHPWRTTLSDHAELFLQFRRQTGFEPEFRAPEDRSYFFNYVSITDDCNCRCPVCFAAAGSCPSNFYLSNDEAEAIAANAVRNRARSVNIIGGEPTVHPRLLDIVAVFRRHGLKVALATNGLIIGRQPALAKQLKDAGVYKVCLQFDSFDPETHRVIRGHGNIGEKLAAARATTAAGMSLGLVCTVTSHNLPELSSFCRTALSWPDPPQSIAFQGAAHTGRLMIDREKVITREAIVASLVDGEAVAGLTTDHFWSIPVFRPLSVFVHPDCSANTVAVFSKKGVVPLSRYVAMDRLVALASSVPDTTSVYRNYFHLLLMAVKTVRPEGIVLLVKHLLARMTGQKGVGFCFIGTGAFLRRDFIDMSRINRCGSSGLTAGGCESLCAFHGKDGQGATS
jgi:uncharacterized radical SAM superfamily Fe-S cluster-containing enzyme